MSKTNKPARTRLKVVKKPLPSFPYEVGSEIGKPPYIRAIEWVHGGNLHTRLFQDLINDGYLKDVTDYPEPTLKSIREDYDVYGYLEDYQVKWLLERVNNYRSLLETLKFKVTTTPDFWDIESAMKDAKHTLNPIEIKFTHDNIETLIEELKKTS